MVCPTVKAWFYLSGIVVANNDVVHVSKARCAFIWFSSRIKDISDFWLNASFGFFVKWTSRKTTINFCVLSLSSANRAWSSAVKAWACWAVQFRLLLLQWLFQSPMIWWSIADAQVGCPHSVSCLNKTTCRFSRHQGNSFIVIFLSKIWHGDPSLTTSLDHSYCTESAAKR